MNNPEILIIDDEPQIRKMLEITLESNGYKVLQATTAKDGILMAANHPPELILLDIGLPDKNGHHVLKVIREWYNQPIIILSVRDSEEDIVMALDNGANDYLIKPFRTGELLARIRSSIRSITGTTQQEIIVETGDLQIDFNARIVKRKDIILKLTSTEFSLISLFAKNHGKVLTHQSILKQIWGPGFTNETQYLRVFVAQLRKKIEDNPNQPAHIITESGVGYRFM
jgi:two-component system KDP operon response regulator KdpE